MGKRALFALFGAVLFFPIILKNSCFADAPRESCSNLWSQASSSDYVFQAKSDRDYSSYLERMKSKSLYRNQCSKSWTVLVYMSAPSDLIHFAYADLLKLEKNAENHLLKSDILVQLEDQGTQEIQRIHVTQPDEVKALSTELSDLEKLTFEDIHSPVISQFGAPIPALAPKRFDDFASWVVQNYPSDNYLLILWGHGQGWNTITSLNLERALADVKDLRGKSIEVLAWDSCYMQSVEDTVELAPWAKYICGSEDIESYAGFDYSEIIKNINLGTQNPEQVAWMIPSLSKKSFDPAVGTQRDIDPRIFPYLTESSVETETLIHQLLPALDLLGIELLKFTKEKEKWRVLKSMLELDSAFQGGTRDLGLFLGHLLDLVKPLAKNAALESLIEKACLALKNTVVQKALGSEYGSASSLSVCEASGLSIWLPKTRGEFQEKFKAISNSSLYRQSLSTGWVKWVREMYR